MSKKLNKAEIFAAFKAEVEVVYGQAKIAKEAQASLNAIFSKYLEPKQSGFGKKVDLSEVTKRDANGKITEILCSISGKWLPATSEFFYNETKGTGIGDTGFRRGSKPGEATLKAFKRDQFKRQQELIAQAGASKITTEQLQKSLAALNSEKVDFSGVNKDYFKNKSEANAKAATEKLIAEETAKQIEKGQLKADAAKPKKM